MDGTMELGCTEHWDSQTIPNVVLLIPKTDRMDETMGLCPTGHWDFQSIPSIHHLDGTFRTLSKVHGQSAAFLDITVGC